MEVKKDLVFGQSMFRTNLVGATSRKSIDTRLILGSIIGGVIRNIVGVKFNTTMETQGSMPTSP